ncbi:ROK family transcriptional regulator [Herpetosiphon llansteffanensis]|uniref:ROK family transcriptional regulator n=1 Tax=Herpetosiphon llansteffanensis TaxID=2094568 RepID=UPI000D7BD349|nr:ROK family transcriptional regulator [Herpetosiphon llansteffanensis]
MQGLPKKASREQSKLHNYRLVFKAIYDGGAISRVDVARLTNLTPTTVSSNVAILLDEGLVQEVGLAPSGGGKPATLLSVLDDGRHLIGLDVAGHELRGTIINLRGAIRQRQTLALNGGNVLEQLYQLIDQLLANTHNPVLGIGIGAPGVINTTAGVVQQAVNLGWHNLALRDLLGKRYGLPVYLANDSHVTAIAEHTFGSQRNAPNLVVINIGLGIGAGIFINGRIVGGDAWGAGEIGHVVVQPNGILCRCGHYGCLETVASTSALLTKLDASLPQAEPWTIAAIQTALANNEPTVRAIIDEAAHYLGIAIANVVGLLNAQFVILAGSLAQLGNDLLQPLRRSLAHHALQTLVAATDVQVSTLGSDIVTLGAAALLLANELGIVRD